MTDSRTHKHNSETIYFTGRVRYTGRQSGEQANNSDKEKAMTGFGTQVVSPEIRQANPTGRRQKQRSLNKAEVKKTKSSNLLER